MKSSVHTAFRLYSSELRCLNQSSATASSYVIDSFYKRQSYILKDIVFCTSVLIAVLVRDLTLISSICHYFSLHMLTVSSKINSSFRSHYLLYWHIYSKQPYAPSIFIFKERASQLFLYYRFMFLHLPYFAERVSDKLLYCITFS